MPNAAIDIGSNSLLLTVISDEGQVLCDEVRVVGLGRGLGDRGLFAPDRMESAEQVLTQFVDLARTHGVEPDAIHAVATSAARRAMNAETFFTRLRKKIGVHVRIISGEEEARLTWKGALRHLELPEGAVLVIDLGGGSTELVIGDGRHTQQRSLEIGSVRLTEAYMSHNANDPAGLAKMRNHIDTEIATMPIQTIPRTVIGVAGTVTTLATMKLGLQTYDADLVHGSRLTRTDLAHFIDVLLPASAEERRAMVPAAPDRAEYLLAGACILDRVLGACRRSALLVSDRGLRYGLLS